MAGIEQAEAETTLRFVADELGRDELKPDGTRHDWAAHAGAIDELGRAFEMLLQARGTPALRAQMAAHAGPLLALLFASGRRAAAASLLTAMLPIAVDEETRAVWAAADIYPHVFADLELARWYHRRGQEAEASRLAGSLTDHPAAALARGARALAGRGRAREPRRSALDGGSRLGSALRTGGVVAALVAAFWGVSHFTGPNRKASQEIAALRPASAGRAGPITREERDVRLAKLEKLIDDGWGRRTLEAGVLAEAAIAMIELMAAPATGPEADDPLALIARLRALPAPVRNARFEARAAPLIETFVRATPVDAPGGLERALRVCLAGRRLVTGVNAPLAATERSVRTALAERLSGDGWAADAFHQLALVPGADATITARAAQALLAMGASPSPWLAREREIESFRGRMTGAQPVAQVTASLERARQHGKARASWGDLDAQPRPQLEALRRLHPDDHEVAVALAQTQRNDGDLQGAIAQLTALGRAGQMTRPAQLLLAELHEHGGHLDEAEALLDQILALDFPDYEEARHSHAQLARDGRNTAAELREQMKAKSGAISVALRLGMVRLQRALAAPADARQALLARAEQTFLSIAVEASGSPSYHLSLGEVYHRLGKSVAGDRELQVVLDEREPALDLRVVRTYRNLGLVERAEQIATKTYRTAPIAEKYEAAMLLSLLSRERDGRETWLRRANPESPSVRADLRELEADRMAEEGDVPAADAKYAEAYQIYAADADEDSSAANNAALALVRRYGCNGRRQHIDAAARHFETSVALSPTSAIAAGNAADLHEHRAHLRVLDRWIDVDRLRPSGSEARRLAAMLLTGPLRPAVLSALKASSDMRRSQALYRRQQVLAPSNPDGYHGQRSWLLASDDDAGLSALADEVKRQPRWDVSHDASAHQERDEAKQEKARRGALARLEKVEASLAPADGSARARRTRAAVALLRADVHRGEADEAPAALNTLLQARASSPELDVPALHAELAVTVAIDEAAATRPALKQLWEKDRLNGDPELFLYDLVKSGKAQTLKNSAVLRAFATRRRADLARWPGDRAQVGRIGDWCLGAVIGDDELTGVGLANARRPATRRDAEMFLTLTPYMSWAKRWRDAVERLATVGAP